MALVKPPAPAAHDDAPRRSRPRASHSPLRNRGMIADQSGRDMFVQALRAVQYTHVPRRGRRWIRILAGDLNSRMTRHRRAAERRASRPPPHPMKGPQRERSRSKQRRQRRRGQHHKTPDEAESPRRRAFAADEADAPRRFDQMHARDEIRDLARMLQNHREGNELRPQTAPSPHGGIPPTCTLS